jgi:hypothetical protein
VNAESIAGSGREILGLMRDSAWRKKRLFIGKLAPMQL